MKWAVCPVGDGSVDPDRVEQGTVYFAVTKAAEQTITLSGTAEDKITMTETGSVAGAVTGGDGNLAAGDTLVVFTVDTGNLLFDEGSKTFTLTVSEVETDSKTVTVSLEVIPNVLVAAVFNVGADGVLTRLDTGIEVNDSINPAPFTSFAGALKWVDGNIPHDHEWLIRVEAADNPIPRMVLVCRDDTTGSGTVTLSYENGGILDSDTVSGYNPDTLGQQTEFPLPEDS
jgi:hypothetical protein